MYLDGGKVTAEARERMLWGESVIPILSILGEPGDAAALNFSFFLYKLRALESQTPSIVLRASPTGQGDLHARRNVLPASTINDIAAFIWSFPV